MRLTFDVRALLRLTAPLVLVVSVAGCGGDSSPTGPQTGNPPESGNPGGGGSSGGSCPGSVGSGTYRATVDGTTYNFTQIIASFSRKKGEFDPDALMLQGGQCDASLAVAVLIMDFNQRLVTGRAYPMPGTISNPATGIVSVPRLTNGQTQAWQTDGGSGTVTFSTLTDTRAVGTMSFVAPAYSGGATGTRTVSNVSFDLTFPATP